MWTPGKIKYLEAMLQWENATVSSLAQSFGAVKSTVSRTLDKLEEEGMVKKEPLQLTERGRKQAIEFQEKQAYLSVWISQKTGQSMAQSMEEALTFLCALPEKSLAALCLEGRRMEYLKQYEEQEEISGEKLLPLFEEGFYPLAFSILRWEGAADGDFSMADQGFLHPARLQIQEGFGQVVLESCAMKKESRLGGIQVSGTIQKLYYEENGCQREARQAGPLFYLPLGAFRCKCYPEEGKIRGMLHLEMESTVGNQHMPKSRARLMAEF